MSKKFLFFLTWISAFVACADESWSSAGGDLSLWSFWKYSNENSSVIGAFTQSDAGMMFEQGSGMSGEGLCNDEEAGFFKYTLAGNNNLAAYDKGVLTVGYQDVGSSPRLPSVILLEGRDRQGNRMLLSCDLGVSADETVRGVDLVAANFSIVTDFYYFSTLDDPDDPNASYAQQMVFNTSSSPLSDEDFSYFLESVEALYLRAFNSSKDGMAVGNSVIPYTYLFSLELTSVEPTIPEPTSASLLMLGLAGLMVRRRAPDRGR